MLEVISLYAMLWFSIILVFVFGFAAVYFIYKDFIKADKRQPHSDAEYEKWLNEHFAPEGENDKSSSKRDS